MRVFVLEDEIKSYPRSIILDVLKKLGHVEVTVAMNVEEAKRLYPLQQPYDLLLLDHDMEGNFEMRKDYPNTGYGFVKWLVDHPQMGEHDDPWAFIHSHNNVGAKRMFDLLRDNGFNVVSPVSFHTTTYPAQLEEVISRIEAPSKEPRVSER